MKTLEELKQYFKTDNTLYPYMQEKETRDFIKSLFPSTAKVFFPTLPGFFINEETGELLLGELIDERKNVITSTMMLPVGFLDGEAIECPDKFIYVFSLAFNPVNSSVMWRGWSSNLSYKKPVTFTITENLYKEFSELADKMAINKSKFIENRIQEFLIKNR